MTIESIEPVLIKFQLTDQIYLRNLLDKECPLCIVTAWDNIILNRGLKSTTVKEFKEKLQSLNYEMSLEWLNDNTDYLQKPSIDFNLNDVVSVRRYICSFLNLNFNVNFQFKHDDDHDSIVHVYGHASKESYKFKELIKMINLLNDQGLINYVTVERKAYHEVNLIAGELINNPFSSAFENLFQKDDYEYRIIIKSKEDIGKSTNKKLIGYKK